MRTNVLFAMEEAHFPLAKPIKVSEFNKNMFSYVYDFLHETGTVIFEGFVSLREFGEVIEWFALSFSDHNMRSLLSSYGLNFAIALFAALIISLGLSYWLKPKIQHLLNCGKDLSPTKQLKIIFATILVSCTPLVFGFVLYTVFRFINPHNGVYLDTVRIISSGVVTIWVLIRIAHLFLKPFSPNHKHIPLSLEVLEVTYSWLQRMAMVALVGFFLLEVGYLINLPLAGERLLLQGSGLVIALLAISMMLDLHLEVRDWIANQRQVKQLSSLRRALLPYLEYSYIPVIVFIVISYVTWVTRESDHFQIVIWKSLVTLVLFPLLRVGAYWLRRLRILCIQRKVQKISAFLAKQLVTYGDQIDIVTISLINIGALLFILNLWGINPSYFILSDWGRFIAEKFLSIFLIIIVALTLTRTGNKLLSKYLVKESAILNDKEKLKQARLKTVSSVGRNVLRIAVWTPAILLIVMEMDIDIVPVLATLGVMSLGLSLGLQSLVKDLVIGFFMLLEDAFAVGDLVTINGQMGYIESLTIRIVRLRTSDGSIYTFPYGSISSLCNQNRDYSAAVILFSVGIDADIQKVFGVLETVTSDLQKDKDMKKMVVGPLVISGVNQINDHSFEIRVVLKTKPGQHYKVRWAFNHLLKQYLESEKIPPATPRQIAYNYGVEK